MIPGLSGSPSVKLTFLCGDHLEQTWDDVAVQAFESLEVTLSDAAPAGFQVQLTLEPRHAIARKDSRVVDLAYFREFQRLGFQVTLGTETRILMDGRVTHMQYSPPIGGRPGTLHVTGEDHSLLLARDDRPRRFGPGKPLSDTMKEMLGDLVPYGIDPDVQPPESDPTPASSEDAFTLFGTKRDYVSQLASFVNHRFFLVAGPVPGKGRARFIRPDYKEEPQEPIYALPNGESNVDALDFTFDATQRCDVVGNEDISGEVKSAPLTGSPDSSTRVNDQPPSEAYSKFGTIRQPTRVQGPLARIEAQAMANASALKVLEGRGVLDAARYGAVLEVGKMVTVSGVGAAYDGKYYVRQVTHTIRRGEYKQTFIICRDGLNPSKAGGGLL